MELWILGGVVFLLVAAQGVLLFFAMRSGRERETKESEKRFDSVIREMGEIRREVDRKMGESAATLRTQLAESSKIASDASRVQRDVAERLTRLDETNRQVVSFADQLQHLQDILKNPKQRGVLGEYYLETVLKNVLPPGRYRMQYRFENGETVDAVIFLEKGKMLSVDSKFSLENYNRIVETRDPAERERLEKTFKQDLKKRIDETAKYIRPREGTMDFAFMFIPSEGVYYDLLVNQVGAVKANTRDLIEYAFQEKRVIIVSPTSFLAYLQTVLQGLKSLQIEEQAKEIQKRVGDLGRHLKRYEEYHLKIGAALGTALNQYNLSGKELGKVDKDVLRITGESPGFERVSAEGPAISPGEE